MFYRFIHFLLASSLLLTAQSGHADVLVAAASSIRAAMETIVSGFDESPIRVSYSSSGSLTHQVMRGAPFDILLSADASFPDRIVEAGISANQPVTYAIGEADLYAKFDSSCDPDDGLRGIADAQRSGTPVMLAIANPELAPYGRAAKQAMMALGVWDDLLPVLVYGNSIAQVAHFAHSGSVDCAVISRSYSRNEVLTRSGVSRPLSRASYDPVIHTMLLLSDEPGAARFFRYLRGEQARQAFVDAGFTAPQD